MGVKTKKLTKRNKRDLSFTGMKHIFRYLLNEKFEFWISVVFNILAAITQVYAVFLLEPIIDNYIIPKDIVGLQNAVIKVGIIYLISVISSFIYMRMSAKAGELAIESIRNDLFNKVQQLNVEFFDKTPNGEIMSRFTNDTDTMEVFMTNSVPSIIRSVFMFLFTIFALFRISVPLSILVLFLLGLMSIVLRRISFKTGKLFGLVQKNVGILNGFDEETLSGQKVIKVHNMEDEMTDEFTKTSENLRQSVASAHTTAGKMMPFFINSVSIMYAIIAVLGVYVTIGGSLTIGKLAVFLSNIRNVQIPIQNIVQQSNLFFNSLAGANRIFEIVDQPVEKDSGYIDLAYVNCGVDGSFTESVTRTGCFAWKWEEDGETKYKPLEGRIDFDHVYFSYDGDRMILKDITFYANPGEKIAFVGSTGAGKTTITNVITRYYDIDSGEIRIDGINIKDITKRGLRKAFGVVLQDVNLFTETIHENIRYGNLLATDEEIVEAARLSKSDKFIDRFQDGYNTVIAGDGSSLSDGQNQLVSIARAAVQKPPMLILDEATSSIDTATEIMVSEAMDKLMEKSTSIVIAHRLSTISNSDVIMVMDDGRIIERGNHEELMYLKGTYYQLYTGELELD